MDKRQRESIIGLGLSFLLILPPTVSTLPERKQWLSTYSAIPDASDPGYLCLSGQYISSISIVGEQTSLDIVGEYQSSIDVVGEKQICD